MWMYVGTYTWKDTSHGIYGLELDETTGQLGEPKLMSETPNPSFLALTPDGRRLYAACDPGVFSGQKLGGVVAYDVDQSTRALTPINSQRSGEGGNCHVGVTPDGRAVACADYGAAVITLLPTRADGGLDPATVNIKHHGHGPNPKRQEHAHAHCASPDPSGQFVIACDLGTDEVVVYRVTAGLGLERHSDVNIHAGSGPRHVGFSKDGRFVYVVNELDSTVDLLRWDVRAGTLVHEQRVPMLPEDFHGQSTAAEVAVHPNGHFVYASNRGHDSLARYHVDRDSGHLSVVGHTPCGGKGPRHFAMDPGGRFLVCAHEQSETLAAFRIDAETGDLTPTGGLAKVGKPVCVLFAV